MTFITQQLRFIVFRNIFIGICSFFLFETTRLINGLPFVITPASLFVLSSTILYYNFHDLSDRLNLSSASAFIFSLKNISLSFTDRVILISNTIISIGILTLIPVKVIVLLFMIALLSLLYSLPLIPWKRRRYRLREILFVKLGVVAFCWAMMAVHIPLVEANLAIDRAVLYAQFLSMALFIFALCIPFEIRDIELEKSRGLKTIPIVFGIRVSRISAVIVLIVCAGLHYYLYSRAYVSIITLIAIISSFLISGLMVIFSGDKPSDFYCKFYVDGLMILQFLLVYLSLMLL